MTILIKGIKFSIVTLLVLLLLGIFTTNTFAFNVYDYVKYIPENSTEQCLINCKSAYEIKNPTGFPLILDESNWWFEFRDKNNMQSRHANQTSSLKNFDIWQQTIQLVVRNYSYYDYPDCTILSTTPNTTWSCPQPKILNSSVQKNEVVHSLVTKSLNITIPVGKSIMLIITGKKGILENVDNIPVLSLDGETIKADRYAWWNTSWNNRVNWSIAVNGFIDIPHINEPFELNLSNTSYIVSACANHSLINCSDIRWIAEFNNGDFLELLHNVTMYNGTETIWTTVILPNQTSAPYNYTLWSYFNNSVVGDSSSEIYVAIDEFDQNFMTISFNRTGGHGALQSDSTQFRGVLGNTAYRTNSSPTLRQEAVISKNFAGTDSVVLLSARKNTSGTGRAIWAANLGSSNSQFMFKCDASFNNISTTNIAETCNGGAYSINVLNEWRQMKFSGNGLGTQEMFIDGHGAGTNPGSSVGEMFLGDSGNTDIVVFFDRFRVSNWNLTFYENDSLWSNGSIEMVSPTPTVPSICNINSFSITNSSATEYDAQTAFLNVTSNNTNVINIDVNFFINGENVSSNITEQHSPNGTGLNNSLFGATFITPIINTNGTNITGNFSIICYLNNGSIVSLNTTPNIGQIIRVSHTFVSFNFTTPVFETSMQNYSVNITFSNKIISQNVTFYTNDILRTNATLNSTLIFGNDNITRYNVSLTAGLILINNTNQELIYEVRMQYLNGSVKIINSSTQNQSLLWAYIPESLLVPNITETLTFTILATLRKEQNNTINRAVIEYNQSNNTATLFVLENSTAEVWQTEIISNLNPNSSVENQTFNSSVFWIINHSSSSTSVVRVQNTSHISQTMILKLCDTDEIVTLNISYFNIVSSAPVATSSTLNFLVYATTINNNRSYIFIFPENITNNICYKPISKSFFNNLFTLINATGFLSTTYVQSNVSRNNVSQNVSIFLTGISTAANIKNITIEVVDENENPLVLHSIEVQRYILANNTYVTQGIDTTDINGKVRFELDVGNQIEYRFLVRNLAGKLLLTTITFKLLETSYRFKVILTSSDILKNILDFKRMQHNLTYNNNTGIVKFEYFDKENISSQICFKINQLLSNVTNIIFSLCSSNHSGIMQFNVSTYVNKSGLQGIAYGFTKNPSPYTIDIIDILSTDIGGLAFGAQGILLSFFIVLLMGGIGMTGSPAILVMFTLLAIGFTILSNLWYLSLGIFIGLIFAGIIIMIKSRV